MAHAIHRPPSRGDLRLSRAVTSLTVAFALAILVLNLVSAEDTALGVAAALVTGFGAMAWALGLIALKVRGDYILGLFGYWWPLMLPRSDEMARSIRQAAFGFSYLLILSAVLVLVMPLVMAAAVSESLGVFLAGVLPPVTPSDVLACALAILILMAVVPQAYLAWTLAPLDEDDEAEGAA